MNIRTGPGTAWPIIGTIPNGQTINWPGPATCVPRQDGIRGPDWCKVNTYNGQLNANGHAYNGQGWVSKAGLVPVHDQASSPSPRGTADPLGIDTPDVVCDAPVVEFNTDRRPDTNPVVRVEITYSLNDHAWRIFHFLANGGTVSRSEQYAIVDMSGRTLTQWRGTQRANPNGTMVGEIKFGTRTHDPYYYEWHYNNGQLDMSSKAHCRMVNDQAPEVDTPTPPQPQSNNVAPSAPRTLAPTVVYDKPVQTIPVHPGKDSVPLYPVADGRGASVDVLVGGNPVRMLLDTGATMMMVTPDLAAKIVMDKQGSYGRTGMFKMADGRQVQFQTVCIEDVRIGSHALHNQCAGISAGDMIMAFPVVNSIAPFKVDTRNRELVFDAAQEAQR
jgi:hypothetical protein